jgi:SRSO17 transposase
MKEELELDHFGGQPWLKLHHHLMLCFMAYSFLTVLDYQAKDKRTSMPTSSKKID